MIENFGLLDGAVQGNEIYLMSADEFTNWLAKASNAQKAWVAAQRFYRRSLVKPLPLPQLMEN